MTLIDEALETQSLFVDEPDLTAAKAPVKSFADTSYLRVIEPESTRVVLLPRDGELLIGRSPNAHIVLRGNTVSRLHARITIEAGVARITDLGSHNGTHVDGARIGSTRALENGNLISICDTKLAVHTAYAGSSKHLEIGPTAAIVADPSVERLYELLEKLAGADLPVLVHGETGSGKELAANALHHWSKRRARPLVALNCAALPESLFESELFGHDEGAFSGATTARAGLFELASGGTLLLDEIGELPLSIQPKLLRVLETRRVARLGALAKEREIDVRVVAATNRDLRQEVRAGRFRQDLYFRLSGATVFIPPLRERRGDIPFLAEAFLAEACARLGREAPVISSPAMQALVAHSWPGNVRELKNLLEYAAATAGAPVLEYRDLADRLDLRESPVSSPAPAPKNEFRPIQEELAEIERLRMSAALDATGGHQKRAAELIAMPLRTFVAKLEKYQLRRAAQT